MYIAALFAAGLLTANLLVCTAVYRHNGYASRQKAYQYAFIWLIPILGAAVAWAFLRSDTRETRHTRDIHPQADQGVSGPEFDRPGLSDAGEA